jgi:tetratricopeptide (TPR) repeat protein
MPQKMSKSDEYSAEFLDINLEAINELATFAQIYQGFTLAFAEVNFASDAQVLLKALKNHPRCQDVQFVVIEIADPELEFVLLKLKESLQQTTIEPDKKIVIVVLGLERAIGFVETEKTPEVLENLNFARNVFTEQLPYPVIFVLPDYPLTRLARGARDFWAWASAVISFRSGQQTIKQAQQKILEPQRSFGSDTKPVKQERIDTLLRLLTQYQPTLDKPDAEIAPLRLNILEELANAYLSISDFQKSKYFFEQVLKLAQAIGSQWGESNAFFGLGRISFVLGNYDDALEKYNQALILYESLDNHLGEANTLQAIGDLNQSSGQFHKALNHYDQALDFYKLLNNRLGEANILLRTGEVLRFLGQHQVALNNFEEALKIYKTVGDQLGEANSLRVSGQVLQRLKQGPTALNRYDDALNLYKSLGDHLGEANTLRAIGDILQSLEQWQEALNSYYKALNLYESIGERLGEANTLKAIGDMCLQREDIDEQEFNQSWFFLDKAYRLYCDVGNYYSQANILLSSIAPVLLRQGRRGDAIAAITEAAEIAAAIGYEPMQQHAADMLKTLQQQEA